MFLSCSDTCRAMQHMFEKNIYPTAVTEEDLFVCNEHVKGYGPSIKILINQGKNTEIHAYFSK